MYLTPMYLPLQAVCEWEWWIGIECLMCLEIDADVAGVFYSIVCKNKSVLRAYYDIR